MTSQKNSKMGRPKTNDPRKHRITGNLTDSEYEDFVSYCENNNLRQADAVNKLVVDGIKNRTCL